ncbi:hypothetical protein [Candidatus Enterococcus ferrettii]|uniref:Restriction endonuclease type IV Mrr domain-containing protein n=1 Tax=Candidatus Enterococcus ferrettii TaxID=2815324 RepID=A0ABV0ET88_9ENTE|nr:hypothetical protein [Enterococcus sp. 665A]MBO1340216.1 hypothetical protein [Enterococcus sp. 665A]
MESKKTSSTKNSAIRGYRFEDFLAKLFDYYNIDRVEQNARFYTETHRNIEYDFILNDRYLVEAKIFPNKVFPRSKLSNVINQLKHLVQSYLEISSKNSQEIIPILIVANIIDYKEKLTELENIMILDISNILYLVRNNEILKEELISILNYSIQEISPKKTEMELFNVTPKNIDMNNEDKLLKQELVSWVPSDNASSSYEKLCIKILKTLFNNDLTLWNPQQKSNENLFRFDLICKIKSGELDGFWNIISDYFRTKYIIFEFKNYSDKITQKDIYTTEKYLYAKALRSVAIIISPYGEDKNSKKAIKGTLRENGKLILSLNHRDIIKMLDTLENSEGLLPSEYLNEMLDNLLINLEK